MFCDDALKMGAATRKLLGDAADLVARAAEADGFTGKSGATLDIIAPAGLKAARLVVIGCGKAADLKPKDFLKLGGVAAGKVPSCGKAGDRRRRTAGRGDDPRRGRRYRRRAQRCAPTASIATRPRRRKARTSAAASTSPSRPPIPPPAKRAWAAAKASPTGVVWARDLINEPANVLYPEEFARRAAALRKLGVTVDVLDVRAMKRLGMFSLLGVGQGSVA